MVDIEWLTSGRRLPVGSSRGWSPPRRSWHSYYVSRPPFTSTITPATNGRVPTSSLSSIHSHSPNEDITRSGGEGLEVIHRSGLSILSSDSASRGTSDENVRRERAIPRHRGSLSCGAGTYPRHTQDAFQGFHGVQSGNVDGTRFFPSRTG